MVTTCAVAEPLNLDVKRVARRVRDAQRPTGRDAKLPRREIVPFERRDRVHRRVRVDLERSDRAPPREEAIPARLGGRLQGALRTGFDHDLDDDVRRSPRPADAEHLGRHLADARMRDERGLDGAIELDAVREITELAVALAADVGE